MRVTSGQKRCADFHLVVESFQPYHAPHPRSHPLWIIHRLWNDDKHRTTPLLGSILSSSTFAVLRGSPNDIHVIELNEGTFHDDKIVARLQVARGAKPKAQAKFAYGVGFDERGPAGAVDAVAGLRYLYSYVIFEVFPAFTRFGK